MRQLVHYKKYYIQDANLPAKRNDLALACISLRQFKIWNQTKPIQPILARLELVDPLAREPDIEGYIHEAAFSNWRMTRRNLVNWVASREKIKCDDSLRTREGAELKEWLI
jgi:hypothetical protein